MQKKTPQKGTSDAHCTPRISLAKIGAEVIKLTTTASSDISALKSLFAKYGIPEEVVMTMDHSMQHKIRQFCSRVQLQAHHQQSPLSPKQWACRESSTDSKEASQELQRPTDGFVVLPHNTLTLVWVITSTAAHGTTNLIQYSSTEENTHPSMAISLGFLAEEREGEAKVKGKL